MLKITFNYAKNTICVINLWIALVIAKCAFYYLLAGFSCCKSV